jgi:uncharacterized protein
MRCGVDVIYQARLEYGPWRGRADFLLRVDKRSRLGAWSYEPVETKLARSTRVNAVIQLCFYSQLLGTIQGVTPDWMHVVLGGGVPAEKLAVRRYISYFRKVRAEFERACQVAAPTYPEPNEHCNVCDWSPMCEELWRRDDHLSLVARITSTQRKALVARNVTTVKLLGDLVLPVVPKIERIGDAALDRIHNQARVQVKGREAGRVIHELILPVEAERGLAALPAPSSGDIFLDLEGYAFGPDGALEYLIGVATAGDDGSGATYKPFWSLDKAQEKVAFEQLIALVMERRKLFPDMHIYHYAAYERTAIRRLAAEHACCIDEVDELLRGNVFVDLYRVVTQALRASVESYSIKKLEPLYNFRRDVSLAEATRALKSFEYLLAIGEHKNNSELLVKVIEGYNRDDCVSTLQLRKWLEARRLEFESTNSTSIPRPASKVEEPSDSLSEQVRQARLLAARLTDGLPADEAMWTGEQKSCWLLAQMLEWHRREQKSEWWEYYRLRELSDDELQEDRNAIGGLVYTGEAGRVKQSIIHRYRFPPQLNSIERAFEVHDPATGKSAGTLEHIDDLTGTLELRRSTRSDTPHPGALIPKNIIQTDVLRESIFRLAFWIAEHGIDQAGPHRAARDLLMRRPPRLAGERSLESFVADEQDLTGAARRTALALDETVFPIQGPPGTGKTYTAARMIVELVRNGKRVGITALSHKVITNLLNEVCRAATEELLPLRAIQKPNGDGGCAEDCVRLTNSNEDVIQALAEGTAQVAAGTAWLWSRLEFANSVDVLFVDEAAQMSLANVLAVAQSAASLVLVGDPQQLEQPQKGIHPPGAEVSAMAHILGDRATIEDDQGLFLAETRRLHPAICKFTSELFYDGRLTARPENERQRINCEGLLNGAGLRFVAVEHSGNQNESPEEVDRVIELVQGLLENRATWTNSNCQVSDLNPRDILVVAPYNAQVGALAKRLPKGVQIGTVDKFQGREAPIVFYSMATSTPEDAPRGMEFLYSLDRLNVAVSRARCISVIVASPRLFEVECRNPRQIELANGFCRYLEMVTR